MYDFLYTQKVDRFSRSENVIVRDNTEGMKNIPLTGKSTLKGRKISVANPLKLTTIQREVQQFVNSQSINSLPSDQLIILKNNVTNLNKAIDKHNIAIKNTFFGKILHLLGLDALQDIKHIDVPKFNDLWLIENSLSPEIPSPESSSKTMNINERMKELGVQGVSIALIDKGKITSTGYGELRQDSIQIQAGSISKTVAGLTVLSLIDQCDKATKMNTKSGLVDDKIITLDTDVSTLLDKDLWASIDPDKLTEGKDKPKMTIRMLLAHTAGTTVSGFDGYPRLDEIEEELKALQEQLKDKKDEKIEGRIKTLKEASEKAFKGKLPTTEEILRGKGNSPQVKITNTPGVEHRYSGGGTTILQKIVEELTGEDFATVAQKRVFDKLDMKNSTYSPEKKNAIHGNDSDGHPVPGGANRYPELAAAGLWSTPTDIAKMMLGIQRAFSGEDTSLISQNLVNDMLTPQTKGVPNGLGVFVEPRPDSTYFFHSGSNPGFRNIALCNTKGQGAVIMTNSEFGEHLYNELLPAIAEVLDWPDHKDHPLFRPLLSPEELQAVQKPSVDLKKWKEYVGKYQFDKHIVEIAISEGKVWLTIDDEKPHEVKPFTDDAAYFETKKPGPKHLLRLNTSNKDVILNVFKCDHKRVVSSQ